MNRMRVGVSILAVIAVMVAMLGVVVNPAWAFDDYGWGCGDDTSASMSFTSSPEWSYTITAGSDDGLTLAQAVSKGRSMWTGYQLEEWQGGPALTGGSPTMEMHFGEPFGYATTFCSTDDIVFEDSLV